MINIIRRTGHGRCILAFYMLGINLEINNSNSHIDDTETQK